MLKIVRIKKKLLGMKCFIFLKFYWKHFLVEMCIEI
jgi:hypothetical protein